MKIGGIALCGQIAFALFCCYMEQDRRVHLLDIFQRVDKVVQSVTLYWPKIVEVECLEKHPRRDKRLKRCLASLGQVVDVISDLWKGPEKVFQFFPEGHKMPCREFPA